MDPSTLVALALSLLQHVLSDAKVNGAAQTVIESLEASIANLIAVHGSDVTFGQLEGLRTKPLW